MIVHDAVPSFLLAQVHNTLYNHADHMKTMEAYRQSPMANGGKGRIYCEKHKAERYSLGCERCHETFCSECVNRPSACYYGKYTRIISSVHF